MSTFFVFFIVFFVAFFAIGFGVTLMLTKDIQEEKRITEIFKQESKKNETD